MSRSRGIRAVILWPALAALTALSPRAAAQTPALVLTADTEGHVHACTGCPGEAGAGGLARRAALIARLRSAGPLLLLDAGSSFFGLETAGARGEAFAVAYESMRYDALNLSHRDLLPGKARVATLIARPGLPFVSANVLDAATGRHVAKPWIVARLGAQRIAVIGLTQPPAMLARLPELAHALREFRIEDPDTALALCLDQAAAEADAVVLLYYGTAAGALRLRQKHGDRLLAILVGGTRPEQLPPDAAPPTAGVAALGRGVTKITPGPPARVEAILLEAALPEDADLIRALAPLLVEPAPRPAEPAAAAAPAPDSRASGPTFSLPASGSNGIVRLHVRTAWSDARYGAARPGEGKRFFVLDLEWENVRPLGGQARESADTPEYRLGDVTQALVLVADGHELRLRAGAATWPGHIPLTDLRLPWFGSRLRGNAVFELPVAEPKSLELRLTDPGGRVVMVLLGVPATETPSLAGAPAAAAPMTGPDQPAPAERGAGAAPASKPAPLPRGLPGVGVTAEQVNSAIDRGADFLWQHIKTKEIARNSPFGAYPEHGLAALALVHAGAHRRHPEFEAELDRYLAEVQVHTLGTYQVGVLAMLVEAYRKPVHFPRLREAARYLIEAQAERGSWDYSAPVPSELCTDPEARVLQVTGGVPLQQEAPRPADGWARTLPWANTREGDNSSSQFALLGLRAAARCDVPVPKDTWRRARQSYLDRQYPDGGWGYSVPDNTVAYGSMTCAGACALALTAFALDLESPASDHPLRRAHEWLAQRFTVATNPKSGQWGFYYLYSLERTGRILETEFFGEHEWYPLGVRFLLDAQQRDGKWESQGGEDVRLATSFALLFLTRATQTLATEVKRGGSGRLETAIQLPPKARIYVILDASGSMLQELEGRPKFEIARGAVRSLLAVVPDGAEVGMRVYGHRKLAIDEGADDDTELVVPLAPLDRAAFLEKLAALRARGKTPLARSLTEAASDLGGWRATGRETAVILLTDGGQDTIRGADPLAAAAKLGAVPGLDVHVVGFDINREDWNTQLRGIAARAKGSYWSAPRPAALERDLRAAVFHIPDGFTVRGVGGVEVAKGRFGETVTLPEGRYTVATGYGGREFATSLWVNTDAVTSVVFDGTKVRHQPVGAGGVEMKREGGFCTGCGKPMAADARFCSGCGKQKG